MEKRATARGYSCVSKLAQAWLVANSRRFNVNGATSFSPPSAAGGSGTWSYVYQGDELRLPAGWTIAANTQALGAIPAIPLGVPTTVISYTSDGRLASLPSAPSSTDPNVESPFPAIYLVNGSEALAVAVHPPVQ